MHGLVRTWALWVGMQVAVGCGQESQFGTPARQSFSLDDATAAFSVCEGRPFDSGEAIGFKKRTSYLWTQQGAFHSAQDIILGNDATQAHSDAWFEYSPIYHPLPGQHIELSVDDCNQYNMVGETHTDGSGWASVSFPAPGIGRYTLMHTAREDATVAASRLWVLPPGTHAVLFDIDGTLTVNDMEYVKQMANPVYIPRAFADAAKATKLWRDKGYVILYITGRPHNAAMVTRNWLNRLGFAVVALHLTESNRDLEPSNAGVGAYKAAFIASLQRLGITIDVAYGNAKTDIYAYRKAGLRTSQIYILGQHAGEQGTQPLPDGYTQNLSSIRSAADAEQPFMWPSFAPAAVGQKTWPPAP